MTQIIFNPLMETLFTTVDELSSAAYQLRSLNSFTMARCVRWRLTKRLHELSDVQRRSLKAACHGPDVCCHNRLMHPECVSDFYAAMIRCLGTSDVGSELESSCLVQVSSLRRTHCPARYKSSGGCVLRHPLPISNQRLVVDLLPIQMYTRQGLLLPCLATVRW